MYVYWFYHHIYYLSLNTFPALQKDRQLRGKYPITGANKFQPDEETFALDKNIHKSYLEALISRGLYFTAVHEALFNMPRNLGIAGGTEKEENVDRAARKNPGKYHDAGNADNIDRRGKYQPADNEGNEARSYCDETYSQRNVSFLTFPFFSSRIKECEWRFFLFRMVLQDVDKVDQTMDEIREQMDMANEVSAAIAQPEMLGVGAADSELLEELEQLEQEQLDKQLLGAGKAPTTRIKAPPKEEELDEEEAELAELRESMGVMN
ncbi:Vacuolar-sorting protein snf7 [Zancudomyces culisetae]|uniref:Vacuolar-sorting protein snf7 n=1 Tax=Zancudomyces culisetae TaxID=1213189 RepID=A0A1R1PJM9_ZANCU|nr:Vacuolar-sorting protein snf7 [Zancudomyces culisetae]|eukprot:OMH81139.1 Vacuolar-sorting protein snf7 [Zancudomyces culisetae]